MLRLFELVGECSYAMESDTVPGVRSAIWGKSRAAGVIIPRLEHAVKAFVRSAQWVRFGSVLGRSPTESMGACCLGLEESSTLWVVLFHGCCHGVGMLKSAYFNNAAMTVERRLLAV